MYKKINDGTVQRLSDGVFIPLDTENVDCIGYHKWLEEGGIPERADAHPQMKSDN
ncbi:hypothetical protein [Achromobacter ruhlandii]|uniref:hypothetical protein n=1 Tax=Achromobacter ruhlandii TaxID=72557 RepID=UPI000AF8674E|nr:hypothetical protein [Achromobacter ruhlandii]